MQLEQRSALPELAWKRPEPISPSPEQITAARVSHYIDTMRKFEKTAHNYVLRNERVRGIVYGYDFKAEKLRVRTALEEAYYLPDLQSKQHYLSQMGEEGEMFLSMSHGLRDSLERKWEDKYTNASSYGTVNRLALAVRASIASKRLTTEQKDQLFEQSGYSDQEIRFIQKQLAKSVVLAGTGAAVTYGLMIMNAVGTINIDQIHSFIQTHADTLRIVSYAANHTTAIGQDIQNYRLNKDKDIGTSMHPLSTLTYYLTDQLFSGKELPKTAASIIVPFTYRLAKDMGGAIFNATDTGTAVIISNNFTAAAASLSMIAGSEWALRHKTRAVEITNVVGDKLIGIGGKVKSRVMKIASPIRRLDPEF